MTYSDLTYISYLIDKINLLLDNCKYFKDISFFRLNNLLLLSLRHLTMSYLTELWRKALLKKV